MHSGVGTIVGLASTPGAPPGVDARVSNTFVVHSLLAPNTRRQQGGPGGTVRDVGGQPVSDVEFRRRWGRRLERVITPVEGSLLAELTDRAAAVQERVGEPVWSELGAPDNASAMLDPEWLAFLLWCQRRALPQPGTIDELVTGPITDVERRRDRDEAIAEAIGFRLSQGLRRQPWTELIPPDVCVMRLVASEGLHKLVVSELIALMSAPAAAETTGQAALMTIKLGEERWLMESVPYHLPGRLGIELLTSDPPDPDLLDRIRLPYRSVLVFFDQIPLDALAAEQLDDALMIDSLDAAIDPSTRSIVAVMLSADPGGRLEPWVDWLIAEQVLERGWTASVSAGLWQRSRYAGAIANLAAICTWGDWRPPPDPPPQIAGVAEGTRDWRRGVQRSAARRAVQRGALTGVRVLDVPTTPAPSADEHASVPHQTGRPVRTHWRAGHWQNYRLATRDAEGTIIGSIRGQRDIDWHYEARWVRPTLVAANRQETPTMTVYQLHPGPPTGGDATP